MERYQKILIVNIKHNLLPHIIISIFMVILTPMIMGVSYLNEQQVARILEMYLALIGVILLIPTFIPDMNENIKDLIHSKRETMPLLHIIRALEGITIIALISFSFLWMLSNNDCVFSWGRMIYTVISNAVFLGGMGMFLFSVSDQIVFAYMIPLIYYVVNYGSFGKKLHQLYLFSMQGDDIIPKHYLFICGVLFMVFSIVIAKWKTVRRCA